jgi:hypothetical protein
MSDMTTGNDFFDESLDMLAYGLAHMKECGSSKQELRELCLDYINAISKFADEYLGDEDA